MLWAFMGHIFLHTWMIKKIYKMKKNHKKSEQTYAEAAKWTANTWLGARPREPGLESPAMGWEIHGKSMDKSMDESRVFGNPDFCQKSRFENGLVVFF